MKKHFKFFIENKMLYFIPLVHFVITFFTDKLFIDFGKFNFLNYVFCKIILFVVIFVLWTLIFKLLYRKDYKKLIKYFLIYFIPLFIILILIFPGIWYSDDFNFLDYAKTVDFLYYLNYLTSVFYSVSLMLIPIPTGVIIIQLIIISVIIAYIVYRLQRITNSKLSYIVYPVFLLPMTIYYNLYCNRPVIYGIFYLGFAATIFLDYLEKKKANRCKMVLLCFYSAILAIWRSEGMYLFVLAPIILAFIYYEKNYIKNICKYFLIILIFGMIVNLPQYSATNNESKTYSFNRFLPSVINPLQWMLTQDIKITDEQIDSISKVLDIDAMKEYPTLLDTPCIWLNSCIIKHSDDDIEDFKKAYINIILNNPDLFVKAKIITFYNSTGIVNNVFEDCSIFYSNNGVISKFLDEYRFNNLINYDARRYVVRILEGRNPVNHASSRIYCYINNLLVAIFALIALLIYGIIKKKKVYIMFPLLFAAHTGMIALTAPASYFMYYYSVYLVGYFILAIEIIYIIKHIKIRKNSSISIKK